MQRTTFFGGLIRSWYSPAETDGFQGPSALGRGSRGTASPWRFLAITVGMSAPSPAPTRCCSATKPPRPRCWTRCAPARMHHAWLITGPDGVGKATLAFRFARRLLAGAAGGRRPGRWTRSHPVFRRVAAGAHADLLTLERGYDKKRKRMRTQIVVDDVRKRHRLHAPDPGRGRLARRGRRRRRGPEPPRANALLKVLEEPPAARHPAADLRRARPAAAHHPQPLPPPAPVAAARRRHGRRCWPPTCRTWTPMPRARLVTLAEGSPGRALLLAEEEGLALAATGRSGAGRAAGPAAVARLCGGRRAGAQRQRVLHLHGPAARRPSRRGARRAARPADPEQERLVVAASA